MSIDVNSINTEDRSMPAIPFSKINNYQLRYPPVYHHFIFSPTIITTTETRKAANATANPQRMILQKRSIKYPINISFQHPPIIPGRNPGIDNWPLQSANASRLKSRRNAHIETNTLLYLSWRMGNPAACSQKSCAGQNDQ